MRPFVFRAQAALDLRIKRDEDAQRDLAAAHRELAAAERALTESFERRDRALDDARQAEATATDTTTLVWYRNWIRTHQHDIARRQDVVDRRQSDADAARERATRTHIDVRVLEKLRDRARRTYDAAVQREEQKAIDWLAVLRSTSQRVGQEDSE